MQHRGSSPASFRVNSMGQILPVSGTAFQASKGFMEDSDSNDTPSVELSIPGKCHPAAWAR